MDTNITPETQVVQSEATKTDESDSQQTHQPDVVVAPRWYWVKDSKGFGSVTVTLVTIAFWVTTLAYILSIFQKIGPLEIRPFDTAATSVYLIPILSLYFGRKLTDAKFRPDK
jgi:hypothetical protein